MMMPSLVGAPKGLMSVGGHASASTKGQTPFMSKKQEYENQQKIKEMTVSFMCDCLDTT